MVGHLQPPPRAAAAIVGTLEALGTHQSSLLTLCSQAAGTEVSDCITGWACAGAPCRPPPLAPDGRLGGGVCCPVWAFLALGDIPDRDVLYFIGHFILPSFIEAGAGRRWHSHPLVIRLGAVSGKPAWWRVGPWVSPNQGENPLCQRHLCAPPGDLGRCFILNGCDSQFPDLRNGDNDTHLISNCYVGSCCIS